MRKSIAVKLPSGRHLEPSHSSDCPYRSNELCVDVLGAIPSSCAFCFVFAFFMWADCLTPQDVGVGCGTPRCLKQPASRHQSRYPLVVES